MIHSDSQCHVKLSKKYIMYTKLCGYKHTKLPEKNTTVKVIQVVYIFPLKTISF